MPSDNDQSNKSLDVFGAKSYGEALKISVEKSFDAAAAVLSRICLPAATELGLWYRDKTRYYRLNNMIKIIEKSKGKMVIKNDNIELEAHPRVVNEIMEAGSWCDNDGLQDMWAGLLAASSVEGSSDANILFANTIKSLNSRQVKILNYLCQKCEKSVDVNGLVVGYGLKLEPEQLFEITNCSNVSELDVDLDSLRSMELLLTGGSIQTYGAGFLFGEGTLKVNLRPSSYTLAFYVKCQGSTDNPQDFYALEYKPE